MDNAVAFETGKYFSKEDYYKDKSCASFSGLKVYARCETLYRDIFVTKVYEEPDHDYFTYGKLVDAMVTETPEFIQENFVRVERRVNPEDALKIENVIKQLESDIDEKTAKIEEKLGAKKEAAKTKAAEARRKANDAIMAKPDGDHSKLISKAEELEKALETFEEDNADKTLLKGIESCKRQIQENKEKLALIAGFADKIQVTNALWENAESTALAIKTHPSFTTMEFNGITSQQVFTVEIDGVPFKGKLDHLKLSPALTKLYSIYIAGQMTLEDLQIRIREDIHPEDRWAIITDVKTCKDLRTLEPYNKHYRGQLANYRMLVASTLLIPITNIRCRILAADKMNNDYKKCELFEYTHESLEDMVGDILAWSKLWYQSIQSGRYVSDKEKRGWGQECFTCTECRFCPFSTKPGEPVLVAGSRFGTEVPPALTDDNTSTADTVLDY